MYNFLKVINICILKSYNVCVVWFSYTQLNTHLFKLSLSVISQSTKQTVWEAISPISLGIVPSNLRWVSWYLPTWVFTSVKVYDLVVAWRTSSKSTGSCPECLNQILILSVTTETQYYWHACTNTADKFVDIPFLFSTTLLQPVNAG